MTQFFAKDYTGEPFELLGLAHLIGLGIVLLVNLALGSNYLFIAHKPVTPSLIDLLGPWPWYILAIEGIALVVFLLLYLPYALKDRRLATS